MDTGANIAQVSVGGDLDVDRVPVVRSSIDQLVSEGCKRVVLNMSQVAYVDSAGMGLIIAETRKMREHGALLSLTNVSQRVMRALSIARIVDMVPVSALGSSAQVSELDPSVLPSWRITVAVNPGHLDESRSHVNELLGRMPLSEDEVFDLGLAVGEAMGNAVDHACGMALVCVACYPDRAIVDVTDCGEGFELAEGEEPPEPGCLERGRGIALMRLLADSVSITRRTSGSGTCVRIVKLFSMRD